eukprot:3228136-Alexandrium_andersonii.AAC.1
MLQDYVSSAESYGRPDATGIAQASVLDHQREAVAEAMEQAGGSAEPQGRPDATGGVQASVPDHKRKAVAVAFEQESPQAVWRRGIR